MFIEKNFKLKSRGRTYLERSLHNTKDPFAYFYLLAKIHKTPMTTRPIVSVSGSLLEGLGKWTDTQLQKICAKLPYIFRSSQCVALEVKNFNLQTLLLTTGATLFTADATSMYTNINTKHALSEIKTFLTVTKPKLCESLGVNLTAILEALEILMTSTTFKLGDTFWSQESGTAMGSPAAPMYATLYFAIYELRLLPEFQEHLPLYGRYIDDVLGVWIPVPSSPLTFETLKQKFNMYGNLTWCFTPLTTSVTFLDIALAIQNDKIIMKPYEKLLNLYLYIPPRSAHPPGGLFSLICGRIKRIQEITTCKNQVQSYLKRLYLRLNKRGYTKEIIMTAINKALTRRTTCNQNLGTPAHTSLFLHYNFHPKNISRGRIQQLLKNALLEPKNFIPLENLYTRNGKAFGTTRVTVCYHRPKNLKHFLAPRKFPVKYSVTEHSRDLVDNNTNNDTASGFETDPGNAGNNTTTAIPMKPAKTVRFNPYLKRLARTKPGDTSTLGTNHTNHTTTPPRASVTQRTIQNPYKKRSFSETVNLTQVTLTPNPAPTTLSPNPTLVALNPTFGTQKTGDLTRTSEHVSQQSMAITHPDTQRSTQTNTTPVIENPYKRARVKPS